MKKIVRNYAYNVFFQLFRIIIPLITTPYLSRILGAEGIGSYAYEYSIVSYFSLAIVLGLRSYGNKSIAEVRDNKHEMSDKFVNIYAMQLIMLIITVVLYLFYCFFFSKIRIIAFIMVIILFAEGTDITWFFNGLEEFRITVSRDFFVKLVTTILVFVFIKSKEDVWKYACIISCGMLVSQLLLWILIKKYVFFVKPSPEKILIHLRPNLIMFIPVVAVNFYKTMDKVMLGVFAGDTEVGYYYSSEKIINVPMAFIVALNTVMLPRMSYITRNFSEEIKINELILNSLKCSLSIATFLGTGIICIADLFVPLFYGEGFEKCIILFWILIPTCTIIAYTNVVCYQFLIPNGYQKIYVGARVIGAFINLLLNITLIPLFMSCGAAIGTLITEMVVCLTQIFAVRKVLPIRKMNCLLLHNAFIGMIVILCVRNISFMDGWIGIFIKAAISSFAYLVIWILLTITSKKYGGEKCSDLRNIFHSE
ncbi:flippase [Butyrivibrio sp. XPD2002]|uniref:flippase n=1 Tax=Butyrivibrio sp. XPD2002 TaxID=1280665 RepID=UPI00041BDC60|nr:flippase [Butyrivibrio sp. XPD2002]